MCRYTQHTLLTREERISELHRRLERRSMAAADLLLALVIGVALASLLVKWWSS